MLVRPRSPGMKLEHLRRIAGIRLQEELDRAFWPSIEFGAESPEEFQEARNFFMDKPLVGVIDTSRAPSVRHGELFPHWSSAIN